MFITTKAAATRLGFTSSRPVTLLLRKGLIKGELRQEARGPVWYADAEDVERYARERRPAHRPKKRED